MMPTNPAKFLQDPPRLGNQFSEDSALLEVLSRRCPRPVLSAIEPDLTRWYVSELYFQRLFC